MKFVGRARLVLLILLLFGAGCDAQRKPVSRESMAGSFADARAILIQNAALVITMDPALGEGPLGIVEGGDLWIAGGKIVAVGHNLRAAAGLKPLDASGKIVLPGFVDTHDHLWQSVIRGCASDQDLYGWLDACVFPMRQAMITEDEAYAVVRLSTLGLIATGVTTVLDWSHTFSPEFVRGNLRALRDSRLRFVFAQQVTPAARHGCGEARRSQQALVDTQPLAGFQIAAHPTMANLQSFAEAVRCAQELHVPLNVHVGENVRDRHAEQIRAMELAGAFDGPLLINHAIHVTDQEVALLARHGVSVAHNPLSNMRLASGIMRLPEMHEAGLKIGLGLDGGTNDTTDMFANMKAAVGLQRARLQRADTFPGIADVLRMATLGGAEVLGLQKGVGSLTPGKKADVIILDPSGRNFAPHWDWPSQIILNGQPSNVEYVFV
ncbi:MAG TPA: amidohydrolase family protein, partial [Methylococcaceae bacterium]|nr:amidohydrolase family protein [Methylococcaceae bacterium]